MSVLEWVYDRNNITHQGIFFLFSFLFGYGDTLFLDMNFLFLTLITLLLSGGQLHRLMVEKRPYFISLEVVRLSDFFFNQGIQHSLSGRPQAQEANRNQMDYRMGPSVM